ncbi:MAG: YeaC family protein [Shewanella sp.]|uniref:YeaC family protein n=1 Tax=Shewanella sp. TaxID=50422 RepID=UPI003F3EA986
MTDINQLIDNMPTEVYERLRTAAELGKWEDGTPLTEAQRESTLQVVMLYQARRLAQTEHFTIGAHGKINELSKAELKKQFRGESIAEFSAEQL